MKTILAVICSIVVVVGVGFFSLPMPIISREKDQRAQIRASGFKRETAKNRGVY